METVLGLSVTATHVRTVLVEGRDATGATLEQNDFAVFTPDAAVADAGERVAEEVLGIAAADGHRLRAIAVTWSEDADLEAELVLDALTASGVGATVPVISVAPRRAAEALAHSIGAVAGYRRTAVCVVEPESVVLSLVDTTTGNSATPSTQSIRSVDALADWLRSVFGGENWHPEGVFLVSSIGGLPALAERLSADLGVPVIDPPGAALALAHGAALAAGNDPVFRPGAVSPAPATARKNAALPVTMMTAGAAAIVVSTSLLVSPALLPDRPPLAAREIVQLNETQTPPPPAADPADPAPPAAVPAPVTAPAEPAEAVAPEPLAVDVRPGAPEAQFVADVPEAPAAPTPALAPVEPPVELPAPPPPVVAPPSVVAPPVPPVPDTQPRLRDRIRNKIDSGLNRLGVGN